MKVLGWKQRIGSYNGEIYNPLSPHLNLLLSPAEGNHHSLLCSVLHLFGILMYRLKKKNAAWKSENIYGTYFRFLGIRMSTYLGCIWGDFDLYKIFLNCINYSKISFKINPPWKSHALPRHQNVDFYAQNESLRMTRIIGSWAKGILYNAQTKITNPVVQ